MMATKPWREHKALHKYLSVYAEPEADLRSCRFERGRWSAAVAIPAMAELDQLPRTLSSLASATGGLGSARALAVVVVNGRRDAPEALHRDNVALLDRLGGEGGPRHYRKALDLMVVDRASQGLRFHERDGVGLARKIGADRILALCALGAVSSRWIHFTDADVEVPDDYFLMPARAEGCAAAIYPFDHRPGPSPLLGEALLRYEVSLRYYVLGLRHAASPYAFHTVGSTIAVDALAYAQVRGVPRRQAAEDFYLLNKLAKVGGIYSQRRRPLQIRHRRSSRVPFGTGAAVSKMEKEGIESLLLYDPTIFSALGVWLRRLEGRDSPPEATPKDEAIASILTANAGEALRLQSLAKGEDSRRFGERVHQRFDALKTMRFIHRARAQVAPSLPFREAIARASFLGEMADLDDTEALRSWIYGVERAAVHGSCLRRAAGATA